MAVVYLYTSHEGHDNKPGLSITDVAENYYGNRSGTRLEAVIRGPMAGYLQQLGDRNIIVAWLKSGASEKEYTARVRPILEKTCLQCHSPASGLNIVNLSSYEGIKEVADVDTGESLHTLMKLSHIHLFGIGLVALGIGFIFRLAVLNVWIKATLILLPFVAILADILAWFLTKWDPCLRLHGSVGRRAARSGMGGTDPDLAVSALVLTGAGRNKFIQLKTGEQGMGIRATELYSPCDTGNDDVRKVATNCQVYSGPSATTVSAHNRRCPSLAGFLRAMVEGAQRAARVFLMRKGGCFG